MHRVTARVRGFLDVKGDDFRARHKPPAKGIDAVASGLPLAMDPASGTAEHLARIGFDVCPPEDHDRWLSREYAEDTPRFGAALWQLLSIDRVARRFRRILGDVLAVRLGVNRY